MNGFAVIDRRPGSDVIAVWITGREGLQARNVNAVVMDASTDAKAFDKVHSLTRRCAVLATEGSVLEGLPVVGEPLTAVDVAVLVESTRERRQAILDAIAEFKRRGGAKSHKEPTFPRLPDATAFVPSEDSPSQRAFTTANFLGQAWTAWLQTDEERRRRTVRPKTGETPWMMPDYLNDPELAVLPVEFAARALEQPLV